MRISFIALIFSSLLVTGGCSTDGLAPVTGKVMNGTKPLTTGTVTFHPNAAKGNKSKEEPLGHIGEDGTYTIRTRDSAGVASGWYKVTVLAQKEVDQTNPGPPVYFVAPQYVDVATTPLSVEVKDSAPDGHYDLKLVARK